MEYLIVGAGPAGMSAALESVRLGRRPVVVDNRPEPGGNIYAWLRSGLRDRPERLDAFGPDYARGTPLLTAFSTAVERGDICYHASTKLWQLAPSGHFAFAGPAGTRAGTAAHVLLATGAQERPVPLPGWTLPGAMGVGAAQLLLKAGGDLPEGRVVIVGAGPLPLLLADQLRRLNRPVAAFVEPRGASKLLGARFSLLGAALAPGIALKGMALLGRRAIGGGPVWHSAEDIAILGDTRVHGLRFRTGRKIHEIEAACVLLHDGIVPNLNPMRAATLPMTYVPEQATWHSRPAGRIQIAGDAAGILGAEAAVLSGRMAAAEAAGAPIDNRDHRTLDRLRVFRRFLDAAYPPVRTAREAADGTVICRCEMIRAETLRKASQSVGTDPNALKRALRVGMGPCQGRMCAHSIADLIAQDNATSPGEIGIHAIRPPILPVSFGTLAEIDLQRAQ
jgi:hypothetical protein